MELLKAMKVLSINGEIDKETWEVAELYKVFVFRKTGEETSYNRLNQDELERMELRQASDIDSRFGITDMV